MQRGFPNSWAAATNGLDEKPLLLRRASSSNDALITAHCRPSLSASFQELIKPQVTWRARGGLQAKGSPLPQAQPLGPSWRGTPHRPTPPPHPAVSGPALLSNEKYATLISAGNNIHILGAVGPRRQASTPTSTFLSQEPQSSLAKAHRPVQPTA